MIKQFVNPNTTCIYTVGDVLGEDIIEKMELIEEDNLLKVTTNHNTFTQKLKGGEVYMDLNGDTFMVRRKEGI